MRLGEKVVGVIGGMGPEATVDFMRRLLAATPARDDADHLHVLVDNNPKIPSRTAALIEGFGEDPTPALCAMARGLEAQGADFLVIPCNTAHHYLPAIARDIHIPLLDMIGLSIEKLGTIEPKPRRIGLLASPAARIVGLYKSRLEQARFEAIFPDSKDETSLLDVIRAVKARKFSKERQQDYTKVASNLIDAGADVFLIACTELSVIGPPAGVVRPSLDTLDVLVESTIANARFANV
jgi:aspartate racemase